MDIGHFRILIPCALCIEVPDAAQLADVPFQLAMLNADLPQNVPHDGKTKWWLLRDGSEVWNLIFKNIYAIHTLLYMSDLFNQIPSIVELGISGSYTCDHSLSWIFLYVMRPCCFDNIFFLLMMFFVFRWASHGLDFLIVACEPRNVAHLSGEDFEVGNKKYSIVCKISHVFTPINTTFSQYFPPPLYFPWWIKCSFLTIALTAI